MEEGDTKSIKTRRSIIVKAGHCFLDFKIARDSSKHYVGFFIDEAMDARFDEILTMHSFTRINEQGFKVINHMFSIHFLGQ